MSVRLSDIGGFPVVAKMACVPRDYRANFEFARPIPLVRVTFALNG